MTLWQFCVVYGAGMFVAAAICAASIDAGHKLSFPEAVAMVTLWFISLVVLVAIGIRSIGRRVLVSIDQGEVSDETE